MKKVVVEKGQIVIILLKAYLLHFLIDFFDRFGFFTVFTNQNSVYMPYDIHQRVFIDIFRCTFFFNHIFEIS